MKYGLLKNCLFISCLLCFWLSSCRINRRIIYVSTKDSTAVRPGLVVDTIVVWRKIRDTFQTQNVTVYRTGDTFRYFFRERNCTTYSQKTIVQPERIREVKKERRYGALDEINKLVAALVAFLVILTFWRVIKR